MSAIDFSAPSEHAQGADGGLEQLAKLADELVEQVGAVRGQYEQLERTLGEEPPETEAAPVDREMPVEDRHEEQPEDDPGDEQPDADFGPQPHDSARLVAMEMAMSGSSREETKTYLRNSLSVDGGDPIVDEVFDRTEAAQESAPLHRRLFTRRRD